MEKRQNHSKALFTIYSLYEIVSVLVLCTNYTCDQLFFPCGLQYIVFCIIFPVIALLVWVWRKELFKHSVFLQRNTNYFLAICLFSGLLIYVLVRPVVFDFTDRHQLKNLGNFIEEQCIKEHTESPLQEKDIQKKCFAQKVMMEGFFMNKLATKRQIKEKVAMIKVNMDSYPDYASKSCDEISDDESLTCSFADNGRAVKPGNWCNCYGDTIAFFIKKDPELRYSNKRINNSLGYLRQRAADYCDKQQNTKGGFGSWPFDSKVFCEMNNI